LAAAALLLAAPPATVSALEYETVPATVEASRWSMGTLRPDRSPFMGHAFTLSVSIGYCAGLPKPKIDHLRVIERPKTAGRPYKSTVITAYVLYPQYQRVIPPPDPGNVVYDACAGLGLSLRKRIKLERPPEHLLLLDGSYSPPRRVWPPHSFR
jgi:hypothetical protein